MKIIPKYVLKHFLPVFFLANVGFVGIYLVVDFFERVDRMLQHHLGFREIYLYFLFKIPMILTQGIPMSAIIAAIIALGMMKRNRELMAMETAGINPGHYVAPLALAGLLLSLLHFGLAEYVVRPLNQKLYDTWDVKIEGKKPPLWMNPENIWYREKDTIYQIGLYDRKHRVMRLASIFFMAPDFSLARRIDARSITWTPKGWLAKEGLIVSYHAGKTDQQWFNREMLDLKITPADFKSGEILPHNLGWLDLYRYTKNIEREGFSATPYEVDLNMRIALPLATLILTLLGMLVALRQGIHGGIAAGVGMSLLVAFAFIAVSNIGSSLASAGTLPPFLGVWAGNIIFGSLALYFWLRQTGR
ncbi:MAG: LPS export ABC transporter permease LptG [Syntrophobacteraceae bacterium]|nr:LPS export ABC transporter permease LptG [Syntrophobacteraceae bacterium]